MRRISRRSVRESVDFLGMGVCYCTRSGRILLINKQMRTLARRMTGHDISNALSFYDLVRQGLPDQEILRLDYGHHIVLHFPQGDVWEFSRQNLRLGRKPILLLQAVEITDEHQLRTQLEQNTEALQALQNRLKQYSQNLQEVTVMEERLQTKIRIHSELGRVLLASRHALSLNQPVNETLKDQWKHTLSLLKGAPVEPDGGAISIVQSAAKQLGVDLHIQGTIPDHPLAAEILAEALNNAVRHGHASAMQVICRTEHQIISMEITNNGIPAADRVLEGGGLSGIRRRVERMGGSLKVQGTPFCIEVWFPTQERSDGYDSSLNRRR